ncbi:hypothetical protein LOD99_11339 [Oopsacas minuta]|uniref:Uncharacterized protein n=1 Tax=Oopsacas minuta TaxID=111878 RepID=A0AAV7K4G5_9METZ|nr:hypothetical protein LOD99_11339 [Oopsacas minuta]
MCQFRSVVNELGWHQLWDPNQLNHYVSSATCSPSTMYCRLRVYERFIHFLRMQIPSLLPTVEQLKGIDSMLCYLKEAIGKDRHLRTKHTMAVSRERMPKSFDVLRLWRSRRGLVEVKQQFVHIDEKTKDISEFVFRQLRNYLIVEILLANAQRSGIIEGMLIKEVLDAEGNAKCDNLVYIYVTNHKTGSLQAAIIYLDVEIYNYLVTMITIVLPLLPSISDISSRNEKNCHVFQTWTSGRLRTSSISSCLRSGLKLFGIHDPDGCPTNYRKAASTLISMHKPSMQESLSQFMCHARSTTERHYRHHMSHRGLSSVFNELAKCQALPSNDDISTTSEKRLSNRSSTPTTQMVTHSDNVTEQINEPTSSNIVQDDHIVDSDNDLDDTLSGILHVSMDINSDSERSCLIGDSAFQYSKCTPSEISHVSVPSEPINDSRYTCKRNGKSIFVDQFQEDTFFSTFGNLIDNALHHIPVTASEVLVLSNTEQFFPLWTNLVNKFGQSLALKKVTDKIRTFARNNRVKK